MVDTVDQVTLYVDAENLVISCHCVLLKQLMLYTIFFFLLQ